MRNIIRRVLNEITFSQENADELKKKYRWRFVQKAKGKPEALHKSVMIYTFTTPKEYKVSAGFKYIVTIEEFEYDYFLISFKPKLNKDFYVRQYRLQQSGSKFYDPYSFLTKENIPLKILSLMISEMKNILSKKPFASFGYFGAADVKTGNDDVDMFNTKRVRVYNGLLLGEFNKTHKIVSDPRFSGSVLINREVLQEYPEFEKYCIDILESHL
jgi:hypothetical protein